jgi:hypothetical protein
LDEERLIFFIFSIKRRFVLIVIGERVMDLLKLEMRILVNDFVRAHPNEFIPDGNVHDLDTGAADYRLAPIQLGINGDIGMIRFLFRNWPGKSSFRPIL